MVYFMLVQVHYSLVLSLHIFGFALGPQGLTSGQGILLFAQFCTQSSCYIGLIQLQVLFIGPQGLLHMF
jgi:hypothetical protein